MGTCTHSDTGREVRMIWTFVVIWVVGGVLFGFMVWAGAVGFVGAFSRRRSWSASKQQHRKEEVGRPLSSQATACRLHVVHAERPTSWHLYPLHGSHVGARPLMVRTNRVEPSVQVTPPRSCRNGETRVEAPQIRIPSKETVR